MSESRRYAECSRALRDPVCWNLWMARPNAGAGRLDGLTLLAMADRAEEMGLLLISAFWRDLAARPNDNGVNDDE